MSSTLSSSRAAEVPAYAQLQREIHDALLAQHPEWILPNGDCPTCDSYEARFAELLSGSLATERAVAHRRRPPGNFSMPAGYAEARNIIFLEMASAVR